MSYWPRSRAVRVLRLDDEVAETTVRGPAVRVAYHTRPSVLCTPPGALTPPRTGKPSPRAAVTVTVSASAPAASPVRVRRIISAPRLAVTAANTSATSLEVRFGDFGAQ